jgi:hypothetical protein
MGPAISHAYVRLRNAGPSTRESERLTSNLAGRARSSPIQTKPRPMPVHDGSRSDQDERLPPPGPDRSQRNPEQLVLGSQSAARSLGVQSQQLLMKSQVFEDEVLAGAESADHPPEEMQERQDHGKNIIGKVRINSCAKSFILWVYDVLARHKPHDSGKRREPECSKLPKLL